MSIWQLGSIQLPGDLEWVDEPWTSRKQIENNTLAGGVSIQRSVKMSGRPITLVTPQKVWVTRQQVLDMTQGRSSSGRHLHLKTRTPLR